MISEEKILCVLFLLFVSFSKNLFKSYRIDKIWRSRKKGRNISFSPCRKWEQRLKMAAPVFSLYTF
jgi:hypothetical protein